MSYRLEVVTGSISEAVLRAGGLMFDRRRAGWQVVVITVDVTHAQSLAILGVRIQPPGSCDSDISQHRSFRAVAAPLELLATTRECAADALLLWGEDPDMARDGMLQPARHELSAAARAFKSHALRCAGMRPSDVSEERFWIDDHAPLTVGSTSSRSRSSTVVGGWSGG